MWALKYGLRGLSLVAAIVALATAGGARSEPLSGTALVQALRQGGLVIVMRHASSPRDIPTPAAAEPGNTKPERQLDEAGRVSARAMGEAFRALKIPVGEVLSSSTFRALQTIRVAGLPTPKEIPELGEGGQSMQPAQAAQTNWLKAKVGQAPNPGSDILMVTHFPNISAAFGPSAPNVADGEALVFRPDGRGAAELIARVKIDDWPKLAAN